MLTTKLEGARAHNLKGVDLQLEPGQVVVVTGVSGAGKSSLALDTLYAEGQRRFVESFSPYARQFLERLQRPPMDKLEPVPAAVAVDRRAPVKSSRSTVATMGDLEPYLAALFAREALPTCPEHHRGATRLDVATAAQRALSASTDGVAGLVTYPVRELDEERYLQLREELVGAGYRRLWLEGKARTVDDLRPSEVAAAGELQVIVDRVRLDGKQRRRLEASIEEAWRRGAGSARLQLPGSPALPLDEGLGCPECGRHLEAPRPGFFSYESPLGACPACRGFGRVIGVDPDKVIPDPRRTLRGGALRPWTGKSTAWERRELKALCERHGISMTIPWQELPAEHQRLVLEGDGDWDEGLFPGLLGWFRWLETRTYKMHVRVFLSRYRSYDACPVCEGKRLNPHALSYEVGGLNLADYHRLEIRHARARLQKLSPADAQAALARDELVQRLTYLERAGLGYLTLDRQARTLSGGEAQRVTLTAALGTSLHNALFVLDEPTVGLHPSDVAPLAQMLRELAQRSNAVLVVEHDPQIVRAADRVVELGPGAGQAGGTITYDGPPRRRAAIDPAQQREHPQRAAAKWLRVSGARANNLADVSVALPLGVLAAVSGPSGSGKSTLVVDVVYRMLARHFGALDVPPPGDHDAVEGFEALKRVVLVDQSPLGRTSRGNPATYTKAWDRLRALLAKEPDAQRSGFSASHFSFNVDGGRCPACNGEGTETVEMQFLADVKLICPVCQGRRFKPEVLAVRCRGLDVAQLLEQTADSILELFADQAEIQRTLGPVARLGLGYLRLGQPLSTLSGGEAQRLKLARALREDQRGTLLILDEPSAGLHRGEVARLVQTLDLLIRAGGSVLVVDHDLDVLRAADWIVDLGPGAGKDGGHVVAEGTVADVQASATRTGEALRGVGLRPERGARRSKRKQPPKLEVSRAREHNLRNVSVKIPHGSLAVITGPSGSGKSTLAFDVIFAEGQRRFLETLTPYARQFLPTLPRPDVGSVTGVPPAVALEQRTTRAGSKSTVATVTEVAHYLRLLYAKLGTAHCPEHGAAISRRSEDHLFADLRRRRGRGTLLAPVVQARKGTYLDVFTAAARAGIDEAICDGELVHTDAPPKLRKTREHDIDLVLARDVSLKRLSRETFEDTLRWGNGALRLIQQGDAELLSTRGACPECGFSVPELDPRFFSFATRQGACPTCDGAGTLEPAVTPRRGRRGRTRKAEVDAAPEICPDCNGERLAPVPRAVTLCGLRYPELVQQSVQSVSDVVRRWKFSAEQKPIAQPVMTELERRLAFLCDVGLGYLGLERSAGTLSGGEMQRLRLAAQLGAGLTGALYVLDEPTIGLHPRDTQRLLSNLRALVDLGSTVLVVEHDADTIRAADYLVDVGPGGGRHGGEIVAAGTPAQVLTSKHSPTARLLREEPTLRAPRAVPKTAPRLVLEGVRENNLRRARCELVLGRFNVVAGVSGSGKSTLVRRVLLPAVRQALGLVTPEPGAHDRLSGWKSLRRAISVDQSPIGRTPRSVPATFLGIWDEIRRLYAATPDAQVAGFNASRFSFNSRRGGRCPTCDGQGVITHEMSFLPDVVTACPACGGLRFEPRTLEVSYLGVSVGQALQLSAEEAAQLFSNHPKIAAPLQVLSDLGAGYVQLGQGSHTLSGGEAQRLKLATELTAGARHEATLYVLDEPTTGLHLADVARLMNVLERLIERGDTLVVIEHHPHVIAGADWVVELGPEGGERGGRVVCSGPVAKVARKATPTGRVLASLLESS